MTGTAPVITSIRDNVPMPSKRATGGRGSRSIYPFDQLTAVGQSFGIKDKKAKNVASVVTNANKKYSEVLLDDNGKPRFVMTEINGKSMPTTKKVTRQLRKFKALNVDPATDPDGASVRVYRIEPSPN